MELLNFDNIAQTLEEYAQEVRNLYQDKLIEADRISSGKLLNSVEYEVVKGEMSYTVTLTLEKYWKYIEYGVQGKNNPSSTYQNPGWKAYPAILEWITVKPVLPRPDRKTKRLPSQRSLAYLITRAIVNNGTEAGGELKDAVDEVNARYREKLVIALKKDAENIMKVVVGGFTGSAPMPTY